MTLPTVGKRVAEDQFIYVIGQREKRASRKKLGRPDGDSICHDLQQITISSKNSTAVNCNLLRRSMAAHRGWFQRQPLLNTSKRNNARTRPSGTASRLTRWAVERIIRHGLRTSFHNIWLVGEAVLPPTDRPLVLYPNHHTYMDGHLAWLVAKRVLNRPAVTWMQEWDRYPFFRSAGALPFPINHPARRARTIRTTRSLMHAEPSTVLVLFPEGRLHPAEEGILHFPPLDRIANILDAAWCPLAIHVSWREADRPDAFLKLGRWHEHITGNERATLAALVESARRESTSASTRLFTGRRAIDKRVDLRAISKWFDGSRT